MPSIVVQTHNDTKRQAGLFPQAANGLREAIPPIAQAAGMKPSVMRRVICGVLSVQADRGNWSEYPNIWDEVADLMEGPEWYKVYDIIEALYAELARGSNSQNAKHFERRLNDFFVENGVGWELRYGRIVHRGPAVFAKSTHEVPDHLDESGFQRAANEMREALTDISRRPQPDITGAIQHSMAALEATAREVTGQHNATLGKLVRGLDLPAPLDQAVTKLWGYASDRGRHIREHQAVGRAEAELIVTVAGAVCEFLRHHRG